ncbi:hypothetical protein K461DRAFT_264512 [Myriangium duriaei CBS 260.36]|uniref:Uncharacterized protein n=1 Tax=Myriangium duriaei CBS 260.36 TaxID=1168546 RepID=A0A9P4MPV2_9PEZI|nr:hypothetical protein K461DRAFT_264512 [Myriangium duriaei CBS 260.36]
MAKILFGSLAGLAFPHLISSKTAPIAAHTAHHESIELEERKGPNPFQRFIGAVSNKKWYFVSARAGGIWVSTINDILLRYNNLIGENVKSAVETTIHIVVGANAAGSGFEQFDVAGAGAKRSVQAAAPGTGYNSFMLGDSDHGEYLDNQGATGVGCGVDPRTPAARPQCTRGFQISIPCRPLSNSFVISSHLCSAAPLPDYANERPYSGQSSEKYGSGPFFIVTVIILSNIQTTQCRNHSTLSNA